MACIRTSIFSFQKTSSSLKNLFTSKMMRRDESHSIKNIIENLEFIDSLKFKLPDVIQKSARRNNWRSYEKFSLSTKKTPITRTKTKRLFIIYRTSGGRYFNVVTDYPTGSSKEKPFNIQKIHENYRRDFEHELILVLSANLHQRIGLETVRD